MTGLPLEFDIAKLLATNGYDVWADYTYARVDSDTSKDFSVDLSAGRAFIRTHEPLTAFASVHMLLECKQRQPDIKWLFFPRVSKAGNQQPRSRDAIRIIDEFYYYPVNWSTLRQFSMSMPVAFKGTEINLDKGDVYDKEIRHGIAQLQYALPSLVNQLLRSMATYPSSKWAPYLIVPILVTTAELYLVRDNVELGDFSACDSLDSIAVREPYLCYSATIGPDFQRHTERLGAGLGKAWREGELASLDERAAMRSYSKMPSAIVRDVESGYGDLVSSYYTDFVVCTRGEIPSFLSAFQQAVTAVSVNDANG